MKRGPRLQAGITLVELLISMTLVATLSAGGLTAYARANATYRTQSAQQRQYERAQYVFGTLEPELQMAGFFGAAGSPAALAANGVPASAAGCGVDVVARIDRPVEERSSLAAGCVARSALQPGSEALIVRRASAHPAVPRAGRALWVVMDHAGAGSQVIWNGVLPPGPPPAELRDLIVRLYYVARSADGDAAMPALRVKTLTEVAGAPAMVDTEVMPGVESLQVDLLPPAAPQSVRVSLRIRADAADAGTQNAGRVLSVTRHFRLRNAS
jgi:hypothetical protein